MKRNILLSLIAIGIILAGSAAFAEQGPFDFSEPACKSWTPACIGGPMSLDNHLLTVRWMGGANIELTYKGQVILLSAYFDRGPRVRSIGFEAKDVKRVDAVFLGHAHFDHMSDAAQVAMQTGATVYAPKFAYEKLITQGVPAGQLHYVHSGDIFYFNGFSVEAFHILHSGVPPAVQNPPAVAAAFGNPGRGDGLVGAVYANPSPEVQAIEAAIQAKGGNDPAIRTEGVVAYLFTFGKDFRFVFYDSANPTLTDEAKNIMARIGGRTDLATLAYQGGPAQYAIVYDMPEIKLFNPRFFFPSHHDAGPGAYFDMPTEPLADAIRQELPNTTPFALQYRQPACFNIEREGKR